jgi:hypothetical protein
MQKSDLLQPRENFGRGNFRKLNSAQLPALSPRPVEVPVPMPGMASPRWENNQCAVRVTVAPTLSTEGSQPNMHWTSYLQSCLEACKRLAGC